MYWECPQCRERFGSNPEWRFCPACRCEWKVTHGFGVDHFSPAGYVTCQSCGRQFDHISAKYCPFCGSSSLCRNAKRIEQGQKEFREAMELLKKIGNEKDGIPYPSPADQEKVWASIGLGGLRSSLSELSIPIRDFEDIVLADRTLHNINPVSCVLLYTAADTRIAKYVRTHFTELDRMSGSCAVYVLEKPATMSNLGISLLSEDETRHLDKNYLASIKRKPLDRTEAYNIARKMGISQNQIPCAVFFTDLQQKEVVLFQLYPLFGARTGEDVSDEELTYFFRTLFAEAEEVSNSSTSDPLQALEKRIATAYGQHKRRDLLPWIKVVLTSLPIKDILEAILKIVHP